MESLTAALVKAPTTSLLNSSPHLIWHSLSSGLPVHVLMHAMFAAQPGDVRQRASGTVHWLTTHLPVAAASSTASASPGLPKRLPPSTDTAASVATPRRAAASNGEVAGSRMNCAGCGLAGRRRR